MENLTPLKRCVFFFSPYFSHKNEMVKGWLKGLYTGHVNNSVNGTKVNFLHFSMNKCKCNKNL